MVRFTILLAYAIILHKEELQDFVNSYRELSDSSIKKVFEQLNQAFKYALDRGYIGRSPMPQVLRPRSKKQKSLIRAMTLEEENKFVQFLTSQTLKECPYKNEYLILWDLELENVLL